MSKRKQFRRLRDLQDNLKKYNAFSVYGYFPLFDTINDAIAVSPVSSYHIHEFEGVEYYMPDGLEMGKTQFHGDYEVNNIESVVPTYTSCGGTEVIIYVAFKQNFSLDNNATESILTAQVALFRYYPDTQTHVEMTGPFLDMTGHLNDNDIAAFDNLIYQYDVSAGKIRVWEADYVTNTYTSLPHIDFPTGVLVRGSNSHTVIKNGDILVTYDFRCQLRFWNISGGPGSTASLFSTTLLYYQGNPAYLPSMGDISYHPLTNSFILGYSPQNANPINPPPLPPFNNNTGIVQFDLQGNIMDYSNAITGAASWRWKGDIYFSTTMQGQGIAKVTFNPLGAQVNIDSYPHPNGTANWPGADNACVDIPTSYDCVQKGNHPKFGFKCKKVIGTGGQYATLQDCIDSGCEGVPPQTGPTTNTPPGGFVPFTNRVAFDEIKTIDGKFEFKTTEAKEERKKLGYNKIRNFYAVTQDIDTESSAMLLHKWKPCPPPYYQNSPFPPTTGPNNSANLPPGCYTSQTIGQMYGLPGISSPLYQLWAQGNAFYNEACNNLNVSQIQPGEVVWLKNYACWIPENPELPGECGYHNWCLQYLGKQATNQHVELQLLVQPSFFGLYSDCEKCKYFVGLTQPTSPVGSSWNCVQVSSNPKFGFKCTQIVGTGGQYTNKQQCIQSGCEGLKTPGGPKTINATTPIITTPIQPIQPRLSDPENEIEELPITPSVNRTGGGGSGSGGY
jgi:hypothetical protein